MRKISILCEIVVNDMKPNQVFGSNGRAHLCKLRTRKMKTSKLTLGLETNR